MPRDEEVHSAFHRLRRPLQDVVTGWIRLVARRVESEQGSLAVEIHRDFCSDVFEGLVPLDAFIGAMLEVGHAPMDVELEAFAVAPVWVIPATTYTRNVKPIGTKWPVFTLAALPTSEALTMQSILDRSLLLSAEPCLAAVLPRTGIA